MLGIRIQQSLSPNAKDRHVAVKIEIPHGVIKSLENDLCASSEIY
jgi:hypothetical protein